MKTINIYYAPYRSCSLNCKYCYLPLSYKNQKKPKDQETTRVFNQFIEKIESERVNIGAFCLHGSEPGQMSPHCLSSIIERMERHWRRHRFNHQYHTAIQSNGLIFNEKYLSELLRLIKDPARLRIGFSIDPPQEVHDLLRNNTFRQVEDNLHSAAEMGFPVSILSVVSKETIKHIPKWIQWTRKMVEMKKKTGNPYRIKIKFATGIEGLSSEEIRDFSEILVKNRLVRLLQILTPGYCISSGNECQWFEFDYLGGCYSCNKTFGPEGDFSDWKKESFQSIINQRKSIFQNEHESTECNECPYQFFCNSGCPVDRWQDGPERGKAHECAAIKHIMDHYTNKKKISISELMNHIEDF